MILLMHLEVPLCKMDWMSIWSLFVLICRALN